MDNLTILLLSHWPSAHLPARTGELIVFGPILSAPGFEPVDLGTRSRCALTFAVLARD